MIGIYVIEALKHHFMFVTERSSWSNNGSCSVSCGVEQLRLIRTCLHGKNCIREDTRIVSCNSDKCPCR